MVIDGQRVITGSFNFTAAAQSKNAENLLVIEDSALERIRFISKHILRWRGSWRTRRV